MKKQLIALGTFLVLALSAVPSFAACPCNSGYACPCQQPACPCQKIVPCCPAAPLATPCCPSRMFVKPCCPSACDAMPSCPCPAAPIQTPCYEEHNDCAD